MTYADQLQNQVQASQSGGRGWGKILQKSCPPYLWITGDRGGWVDPSALKNKKVAVRTGARLLWPVASRCWDVQGEGAACAETLGRVEGSREGHWWGEHGAQCSRGEVRGSQRQQGLGVRARVPWRDRRT